MLRHRSALSLALNDTDTSTALSGCGPAGTSRRWSMLFERGALPGGDLLSIEGAGGKKLSDDALLLWDIKGLALAFAVLGVRAMRFLWKQTIDIASRTRRIAWATPPAGSATAQWSRPMRASSPSCSPRCCASSRLRTPHRRQGGGGQARQGLRIRGALLQSHHRHPHLYGEKDLGLRALEHGGNAAAACADLLKPSLQPVAHTSPKVRCSPICGSREHFGMSL